VRVASIPAVLPSPALSPQQHAPPISAFAAATAVADGSGTPADPADAPQTDGYPPSSAGAPDAESVDGALSAVTVCSQSHHVSGQHGVGSARHSKTRDAPYCVTPSESLLALVVARHAAAPPSCTSECWLVHMNRNSRRMQSASTTSPFGASRRLSAPCRATCTPLIRKKPCWACCGRRAPLAMSR